MTNLTPLRGRYQATKQMENPASRQTVAPQAAMMPKQTVPAVMKPPKAPKMPTIKPPKAPSASQSFAKVPTPGMPKMGGAMEKEAFIGAIRGGITALRSGAASGALRKGANFLANAWNRGGGAAAAKAAASAPSKVGLSQLAHQLPEKMTWGRRLARIGLGSPNLVRNTYKIPGGRTVAANGAVGKALLGEGAKLTSRGLLPKMGRMGAYGAGGSYALSLGARPPKKAAEYFSKRRLEDAATTAAGTAMLGGGLTGGVALSEGGLGLLSRGYAGSADMGGELGSTVARRGLVGFRRKGVKGMTV